MTPIAVGAAARVLGTLLGTASEAVQLFIDARIINGFSESGIHFDPTGRANVLMLEEEELAWMRTLAPDHLKEQGRRWWLGFNPRQQESIYEDPQEALEAVSTAGLWPWETEGERAVRWRCPDCQGTGRYHKVNGFRADETSAPCMSCESDGYSMTPPAIAPFLDVACRGPVVLGQVKELVSILSPGGVILWKTEKRPEYQDPGVNAAVGDRWGGWPRACPEHYHGTPLEPVWGALRTLVYKLKFDLVKQDVEANTLHLLVRAHPLDPPPSERRQPQP